MSMENRIERLEKTRRFSREHGIRVIIMQSQGYPKPTDEQVADALNKYDGDNKKANGMLQRVWGCTPGGNRLWSLIGLPRKFMSATVGIKLILEAKLR